MPYDGSPEIKDRDGKISLCSKKIASKLTSTYVGSYSDKLYQLLLKNACEAREIRK